MFTDPQFFFLEKSKFKEFIEQGEGRQPSTVKIFFLDLRERILIFVCRSNSTDLMPITSTVRFKIVMRIVTSCIDNEISRKRNKKSFG